MTLVHYSAAPLTFDAERTYEQPQSNFKPNGLWLSVEGNDDGWKQWCEGEDFNVDGLVHQTELILKDDANVLVIDTVDALDEFTRTYRWKKNELLAAIDWTRVSAMYDGIIIAPYLWSRRHTRETFWYYPWDCASACIWNVRVLETSR